MYLSHKQFSVIGDIEGRDNLLESLISMSPYDTIISVGDAHDRGNQNKRIFELFMTRKNYYMLQSNHTQMMLDFYDGSPIFDGVGWINSGGKSLLFEYGVDPFAIEQMLIDFETKFRSFSNDPVEKERLKNVFRNSREVVIQQFREKIEPEVIQYLRNLPFIIENEEVVITHAPINPTMPLVYDWGDKKRADRFLWNRGSTRRIKDKFQIHGHIAMKNATFLKDKQGIYGINIDSSQASLSMFNWPSMQIEFVDLPI